MDIETLALHGGYQPDSGTGATSAIHQTAAYAYPSAAAISDVFGGRAPGYVYSRIGNPTSSSFERRLTELEKGVGCIACSSGMAAISSAVMGLTRAGDHVVSSSGIFGGTVSFFAKTLSRFGIETTFVDPADLRAVEQAIDSRTRLIFVETITNPGMGVPDLPAIAEIAHNAGIPLVVDSTVTTPILVRPGEWGADIVVHSVSKFINGHGNAIGGAIIDTGNYDWSKGLFEDIRELARRAGKLAFLAHLRTLIYRDLGGCPSPFNSFLNLIGIEGLPMRMEVHCRNALGVAQFLSEHPKVRSVSYPGLESSPYHDVAKRLFDGKFGAVLTFSTNSGDSAARFVDNTSLAQNLANIGDSKTLVIHPGSTIFQEFTSDEREEMGAPDDLVRVSVGVESLNDIIADFSTALDCV